MKRCVKFLFFTILCATFNGFVFTTALCQETEENLYLYEEQELESVPISSNMGTTFSLLAQAGKKFLDDNEIRTNFLKIDARAIDENNPAYALLRMNMDEIHKSTGVILKHDIPFKGSGTILYRLNDHILVLTAYHNFYDDISYNRAHKITQMRIIEDNRDKNHPDSILAEMAGDNYIRAGKKDIGLVAMKLNNGKNFFENDKVIFSILDFSKIQQSGQNNSVQVQINQYPAFFDWYIKGIGTAYHVNGTGYHDIPTLPGASGSGVIVNNNIVGVHVSSGNQVSKNVVNVQYKGREVLVENNIFELISLDDIEQENIKLSNSNNKPILTELIQKYINSVNQQKRDELIEYLKHGRKIKNDKDTNPEFLKEINKLNEERMFWTSWVFWPKKIEEITNEVVEAYSNARAEL
jgi:hypothetical protein